MLILFSHTIAFLLVINVCFATTLCNDQQKANLNGSEYSQTFDEDMNRDTQNLIESNFDEVNNREDHLLMDSPMETKSKPSGGGGKKRLLERSNNVGLQILKQLQIDVAKLNTDIELIKFGLINMSILPTGRYYYHQGEMVKWLEAKHFCEERNLHLAVINSNLEIETLFDAAPHLRDAFWLDATDIGREPGDFFWPDGRDVDRWWWDRENGQPNDFAAGNQTAVCLSHLHRGRLCDGSITLHKAYFICEA